MVLQEDTAGTTMVDEFPAPQGGWVTIDLANVQRLRTTEQGNPPPPQIVQESILTAPLQRTKPQGLQPDLASVCSSMQIRWSRPTRRNHAFFLLDRYSDHLSLLLQCR
eukprot:4767282-Amphidinium_carterae.1